MQEEVNEKVIAISIQTSKLTAEVLQKAIHTLLVQMKEHTEQSMHHTGKQSLKQLMRQNTGVSSIEVTNDNIKAFEKTAKKYGIDFAIKRVHNETQSRYLVFFKGRDTDVLTAAFNEFSIKKLQTKDKPSIRHALVNPQHDKFTPKPTQQKAKKQVKEVDI